MGPASHLLDDVDFTDEEYYDVDEEYDEDYDEEYYEYDDDSAYEEYMAHHADLEEEAKYIHERF